ncbi:MAG TPA: hemolysin family protein [Candidatus Sulfotelmatobacter sp.]|nr:hemolysin family protein [Candidatus Sulfotelmatobacter sp.]
MIAFVLLRVLLILLLVAANAFFAAAEFSLVSVRETRIQQLISSGRISARIVQRLHQHLDEVVNGVQLGITMVSLTLGWIGEPMVARLVESLRFVHEVPHAAVYAHGIAIVIAFTLITYLHVLLGELVPKTLALQRAEQVALAIAAPMEAFLTIARPVLFFMRQSGGLVLKLFGARDARRGGAVHSPDELKLIVTASRQFGQIPESQEEMIHNAIELDSITVREVMVARPDIFSLPSDLTLDEALNKVVEGQHSRIPVYDPQSGPEHIVGVLYYKELVRWVRVKLANLGQPVASRISRTQIGQIMHDVLVVPETKVLAELLDEFKQRRRHLAVVVDEFGSTAGVITVEDILEQLVGDIEDEFDVATPEPELGNESILLLEGAVNIRDLETQYDLVLPRDAGFETLAGFVLARLQRIPYLGESFEYEGHRYTVEEMEGHRIAKVKIEKIEGIDAKAQSAKQTGD